MLPQVTVPTGQMHPRGVPAVFLGLPRLPAVIGVAYGLVHSVVTVTRARDMAFS